MAAGSPGGWRYLGLPRRAGQDRLLALAVVASAVLGSVAVTAWLLLAAAGDWPP